MTTFNHFNFNVLDLEKSLAFYKEALNLTPVREKTATQVLALLTGEFQPTTPVREIGRAHV